MPRRGPSRSIMVFARVGISTKFTEIVYAPWTNDFVNLQIASTASSVRLGNVEELAGELGIGDLGLGRFRAGTTSMDRVIDCRWASSAQAQKLDSGRLRSSSLPQSG